MKELLVLVVNRMSNRVPENAGVGPGLIDALIAEQSRLTAVEQFARRHERGELPAHARQYRDLMPASAPAPGQQYAFEVDLDQCSGCKACVTACHSLNGLDDDEAWREVGALVSTDWRQPLQKTVTTACHHCVDPECLNGCPVLAYEKDSVTGIVRHLDDQCIGCQYCVMKCPYEVPKYSAARGIVRKCDMCSQRLAVGEAPACVQACPNEAISITVVEQAKVRGKYRQLSTFNFQPSTSTVGENTFLTASPNPAITLPTTRYVSSKPLPAGLAASNAAELRPQPAHTPLVWMLVLTQLSIGAFALSPLAPAATQSWLDLIALASLALGLAASTLHLGKPTKAWRSFLGWRRSWMSREIIVFSVFAPLLGVVTFARGLPAALAVHILAGAVGVTGVFCSAMIYHDTRRPLWVGARSIGRFFGTTALLGLAVPWATGEILHVSSAWPAFALAAVSVAKLAGEHRLLRRAGSDLADELAPAPAVEEEWALARSARLMRDKFGVLSRTRVALGVAGGVALPLLSLLPCEPRTAIAAVAFLFCLLGELIERHLFFRAVVARKMPGVA
ncbi:MAG TPA: DmsC/YnfH family molybdoenzyme membrane anchor subunit [Verrucomicrobiae bacterium]